MKKIYKGGQILDHGHKELIWQFVAIGGNGWLLVSMVIRSLPFSEKAGFNL
jgi:hypothetical protein